MKKQTEIRIPFNHPKEIEDLQETLIMLISNLGKATDKETKQKCIYWLSRILMFSEHPYESLPVHPLSSNKNK